MFIILAIVFPGWLLFASRSNQTDTWCPRCTDAEETTIALESSRHEAPIHRVASRCHSDARISLPANLPSSAILAPHSSSQGLWLIATTQRPLEAAFILPRIRNSSLTNLTHRRLPALSLTTTFISALNSGKVRTEIERSVPSFGKRLPT